MSLGGEDEFFKFIKFLEDGKVGTLRRFMKILEKLFRLSLENKYHL